MAATIKGITTLVFGCDTVSTVIMQSVDSETSGEVTYVQDEDSDFVGFALHAFGKREASGEYVYKGADCVTALGVAITLTNAVGATLGGVGIIGGVAGYSNANVVLSSGASTNSMATLAPGTIDVNTGSHIFGTLTIGGSAQTNNIAFGKFTRLYVQLGAAPGSNDCLAVNGKIDLGSGSNTNYLDVGILSGTPKSGDYTLATFNVLTGRFFAVRSAPGTTLPKGWRLNYPGTGTGNGNELINGSIVFSIPGGGTALFMR